MGGGVNSPWAILLVDDDQSKYLTKIGKENPWYSNNDKVCVGGGGGRGCFD